MEGAARPGREPGAAGGRQLRQRLLRRHPRHRRRPGRADAAGRLRGRRAGGGEAGGVPGLRRRRGRRAGARGDHRLVAGRGRAVCVRRGLVLHRRLPARTATSASARSWSSCSSAWSRSSARRTSRPRRGSGRAVRRRRGRCAGLRDPRRQQPARHPERHRRRQAHARGRSSAPTGPVRSTCCSSSPLSWRVVAVAVSTTWWALLGLGFLAPAAPAVRTVTGGANGPSLVPVLQQTGLAELTWAVLVSAALALG